MAIRALVMSVAYEESDKNSKETIMRTIKWEQNPANLKPDVWYPDDDEFSDDREQTHCQNGGRVFVHDHH